MKDSSRAGMRRLSMRVAALAVMPGVAFAQAAAGGGGGSVIRAGAIQRDSTIYTRPVGVVMISGGTQRIDSLVRSISKLQIGSPEYTATYDSLRTEFRLLSERTRVTPARDSTTRASIVIERGFGLRATDVTPRGRMGFRADGVNEIIYSPAGQFIQYFEYPTVVEVEPNSPALQSGLKVGDLLLAYNGYDLRRQAINMTSLLTPGREVEIRLRRDGESKNLTLRVVPASASAIELRRAQGSLIGPPPVIIPDSINDRREVETRAAAASAAAARSGIMDVNGGFGSGGVAAGRISTAPTTAVMVPRVMSAAGVYGAAMMDVDADLAESIVGMTGRKNGVYVISVPTGSMADRNGLKRGDVILRLDTNEIPSIAHLRVRLMQADANGADKVKLTVLRGGKMQELTVETGR